VSDTKLALLKALSLTLAGMSAPSADTGAAAVLISLVDHPADNALWPVVVLESHEVTPRDAFEDGATENEHTLELEVWSRYRGSRQVLAILGVMYDRLHNAALVLESGQSLSCRVSRQLTTREPDGTTYQGSMTLTIITADEEI